MTNGLFVGLEPDELIGTSRDDAQARAAAAGLSFRDMTPLPVDGVDWLITDDNRPDRVNVWFGQDGSAERDEVAESSRHRLQ